MVVVGKSQLLSLLSHKTSHTTAMDSMWGGGGAWWPHTAVVSVPDSGSSGLGLSLGNIVLRSW